LCINWQNLKLLKIKPHRIESQKPAFDEKTKSDRFFGNVKLSAKLS
jgi:hypothetical protein